VQAGANIIGGHSGMNDTHVRAIANSVRMTQALSFHEQSLVHIIQPATDQAKSPTPLKERSKLGQKLATGQRVVSVEINPPRGVDHEPFLDLCQQLVDGGIEFVNIPDGARAVARISSTQLASYITQKFKLEPIPHFTSRDRNLIGLQSDLLGAHVNGVRNLLLVTGDPPKLGNNPGATGVYDVDAIGMTHIVARLNQGLDLGGSSFGRPTDFVFGVALNPTAANQELECKRFRYKLEAGAEFAITQPIYDVEAYQRFFDQLGQVSCPIIMGIWPLVSLRNAEFLKNEVPGVSVPDWVLAEMEKAGDNKEEAVKRGLEIAMRTMQTASKMVAGFQVSAPFNRVKVALEAIHALS
jgi:methionine synthase / methylenetetrahydrofolate reductase(NADPH)